MQGQQCTQATPFGFGSELKIDSFSAVILPLPLLPRLSQAGSLEHPSPRHLFTGLWRFDRLEAGVQVVANPPILELTGVQHILKGKRPEEAAAAAAAATTAGRTEQRFLQGRVCAGIGSIAQPSSQAQGRGWVILTTACSMSVGKRWSK